MTVESIGESGAVLDRWKDTMIWTRTSRFGKAENMLVASFPVGSDGILRELENTDNFTPEVINRYLTELLEVYDYIQDYCRDGGLLTLQGEILAQGEDQLKLSPSLNDRVEDKMLIVRAASMFKKETEIESLNNLSNSRQLILVKKDFYNNLGFCISGANRLEILLQRTDDISNSYPVNERLIKAFTEMIGNRIDGSGLPRIVSPRSLTLQLMVDMSIDFGVGYLEVEQLQY